MAVEDRNGDFGLVIAAQTFQHVQEPETSNGSAHLARAKASRD